jgi:hypothetical protein
MYHFRPEFDSNPDEKSLKMLNALRVCIEPLVDGRSSGDFNYVIYNKLNEEVNRQRFLSMTKAHSNVRRRMAEVAAYCDSMLHPIDDESLKPGLKFSETLLKTVKFYPDAIVLALDTAELQLKAPEDKRVIFHTKGKQKTVTNSDVELLKGLLKDAKVDIGEVRARNSEFYEFANKTIADRLGVSAARHGGVAMS